jgi:Ran GTPase-activating protein 1
VYGFIEHHRSIIYLFLGQTKPRTLVNSIKAFDPLPLHSLTMIFIIQPGEKKIWSPQEISPYLEGIGSEEKNIQSIHLSGNSFSEEVIEIIVDRMRQNKHIKKAILSDIFTGRSKCTIPPSILSFARLFHGNSSLVELDLSDNAVGAPGAKALISIIVENRSLQTLRINNNGLGPAGGLIIAEALVELAKLHQENGTVSQLKKLVIGRNRLECSSVRIAEALSMHSNFQELTIAQNGIRPEWIVPFFQALRGCKSLTYLDVQDNTLTESGAAALASALPAWPLIEHLNLSDCLLRANGGKLLFEGIANAKELLGLKVLNLQFNELNEDALFCMLKVASGPIEKLESLQLNGNEFHPQGKAAMTLKKMFAERSVLDEWDELEYSDSQSEEESEQEDEELLDKMSRIGLK